MRGSSWSRVIGAFGAIVCLPLAAMCATPAAPRDPALVKQQYEEVAARLETGGDLYVIANVDGLVQGFVNQLVTLVALAPTNTPEGAAARAAVAKVPAFLDKNGFYAARAFGMSVVPRPDGLNSFRTFIARDRTAARSPLWKACWGGPKPRRLQGVDFLPPHTALAVVGNGSLPTLWTIVRQGVKEIASPKTAADFEKGLANASAKMGVSVDKLMASLGDEGFYAVQIDTNATVSLPGPQGPISLAVPSILIGVAIQNDSLPSLVERQLATNHLPVASQAAGGVTIKTVNLPLPLPIPVQPSFAVCSNYFLFGTTTRVVADAVQSLQKKDGLAASAAFRDAFKGLPMENNGLAYADPSFGQFILEIQKVAASFSRLGGGQDQQATTQAVQDLLNRSLRTSQALVTLTLDNGVLTQGATSSSGKDMVASLTMAPIGMMAAIAIPSFVKARETSQKNACINNLRLLDAAKEQWALEQKKTEGDEADQAGVLAFIKGNAMPVCPKGGTYSLNAIGQSPTCSIPDHALSMPPAAAEPAQQAPEGEEAPANPAE